MADARRPVRVRIRAHGVIINDAAQSTTTGRQLEFVWPRFEWEPPELVGKPVWLYPRDRWSDERFRLGAQHDALRDAIGSELDQLTA